jgi:hypothetical protein
VQNTASQKNTPSLSDCLETKMNCKKKKKDTTNQWSSERFTDMHTKFNTGSDVHGSSHVGSVQQQTKIPLAKHFSTRPTEPIRAVVIISH